MFVLTISYFTLVLAPEEQNDADAGLDEETKESSEIGLDEETEESSEIAIKRIACGITLLCLVIYSLWIESMQIASMKEGKRSDYFLNPWNLVDNAGLLMTFLITVLTLTERDWISMEYLRCIASFASIFLVLKLYDWLRLFESTAFYVALVMLTL